MEYLYINIPSGKILNPLIIAINTCSLFVIKLIKIKWAVFDVIKIKLYIGCGDLCTADSSINAFNDSDNSNYYSNCSAEYSSLFVLLYQYFYCIIAENKADIVGWLFE